MCDWYFLVRNVQRHGSVIFCLSSSGLIIQPTTWLEFSDPLQSLDHLHPPPLPTSCLQVPPDVTWVEEVFHFLSWRFPPPRAVRGSGPGLIWIGFMVSILELIFCRTSLHPSSYLCCNSTIVRVIELWTRRSRCWDFPLFFFVYACEVVRKYYYFTGLFRRSIENVVL